MYQKKNTLLELVSQSSNFNSRLKESYLQRDGYRCGFFCAKALVNYLGTREIKGLGKELNLTRDGVRQERLIKTLRNRGVSAYARYDLDKTKLEYYLAKGKSIIIYHSREEHWMVLSGIKNGMMEIYDPEGFYRHVRHNHMGKYLGKFGIICSKKTK